MVLLDLSSAFDLVNPDLLIAKLSIHGLDTSFLEWMSDYLRNRKQATWIDHTFSDWLDIHVGVPQGSILGPLLFIIFTNDLPFFLTCELDMYADDSTITSCKPTMTDIRQDLIDNCDMVSSWIKDNEQCLNADKTHFMLAGTKQRLRKINPIDRSGVVMDGHTLLESEDRKEKLLGVTFQSDLKWHSHIIDLQRKLKDRIFGLNQTRWFTSEKFRKILAEGLFTSVLTYCMPVWGGTDKGHVQELQVLQNRVAEIVLNLPLRSHRNMMYDKLEWMTVNQLVLYHSLIAVYRIRQTNEPEYLANFLKNDNFRGQIIVPFTNLTLCQRSFCYRAAENWNVVPYMIRSLQRLDSFKRELKKWVKIKIPRFV